MRDERLTGEDARQVLNSPAYKAAFARMSEALEGKALACDPDNKEQAQRVVIAKQILAGIHRELNKMVEFGQMAEIKLTEIEKRRKSVFRR